MSEIKKKIVIPEKYKLINDKIINFIVDNDSNLTREALADYYQRRVFDIKSILSECDIAFLNYINHNYTKDCKILELAAGIGQVSLILLDLGYKNCAINDANKQRIKLSEEISKHISNTDKLNFHEGYLQNVNFDNYDLIFCVEGTNACVRNNTYDLFVEQLNKGKHIIIIDGIFGPVRDTMFSDKLKKNYNYEIIDNNLGIFWRGGNMNMIKFFK